MSLVYATIGGVIGALLGAGSGGLLGLAFGAVAGVLLTRQTAIAQANYQLKHRVERLEAAARRTADTEAAMRPQAPQPADAPAPVITPTPTPTRTPTPTPATPPAHAAKEIPRPAERHSPPPVQPAKAHTEHARPINAEPDFVQKLVDASKRWLTTGNVPVKMGVIVSFFGVAFLLKYFVDLGALYVPLEMRYLLVALAAVALFHVGWRLRPKMRVYGLSLMGGGIGILYLTIFAAFRLSGILPAPPAFAMLVLLTAAIGYLAVTQNALSLAVLGTVGGFLAPVLISTGSGSHVVLFGYYLVLNGAILGIAWHKAWRGLNLIGFVFTFGIATIWGGQYYRPEFFSSTEPFLIAFFLFYHAISILFAFRQPPNLRGLVDGTLIFGTPGIAFALQSQLLGNSEYGLAISAAAAAAMYAATALWLYRLKIEQMRLLIESFFSLAVAFGTIAIPLAVDDRWTAIAWALEGAALVWVGVRQSRFLSKISGTVLLFGSGLVFVKAGWTSDLGMPILNGNVISGALIALLSLLSAYRLSADPKKQSWQPVASIALLLWGLAWWLGTGAAEINDRLSGENQLHTFATFIAMTAVILGLLAKKLQWVAAQRSTLAFLPAVIVLAFGYLMEFNHVFTATGAPVWLILIGSHFAVLGFITGSDARVPYLAVWHYVGGMLIAGLIAHEASWRIDQTGLSEVWVLSGAMFILTAMALGISYGRKFVAWPLQQHELAYASVAASLIVLQMLVLAVAGTNTSGDPAPVPYVPLLNPYDVLTLFVLGVALYSLQPGKFLSRWLGADELKMTRYAWAGAAFLLSTIALVRGVHHLAGVEWSRHTLTHSVLVQSSLSIYWAVLGLGSMIFGVRRVHRQVWMVGAGLMVLVVVKLGFVDLSNSGTLARIISFLGVGGMLLIVGRFAPAPPKQTSRENDLDAAETG